MSETAKSSLRSRLIEAGARQLWQVGGWYPEWDDIKSPYDQAVAAECRVEAEAALGVFVEVLDEGANEAAAGYAPGVRLRDLCFDELVAVLRDGGDESER